jgi:hypothetical protein
MQALYIIIRCNLLFSFNCPMKRRYVRKKSTSISYLGAVGLNTFWAYAETLGADWPCKLGTSPWKITQRDALMQCYITEPVLELGSYVRGAGGGGGAVRAELPLWRVGARGCPGDLHGVRWKRAVLSGRQCIGVLSGLRSYVHKFQRFGGTYWVHLQCSRIQSGGGNGT